MYAAWSVLDAVDASRLVSWVVVCCGAVGWESVAPVVALVERVDPTSCGSVVKPRQVSTRVPCFLSQLLINYSVKFAKTVSFSKDIYWATGPRY